MYYIDVMNPLKGFWDWPQINAWCLVDGLMSCRRGGFGPHYSWRSVERDQRRYSLSHPGSTLHRGGGPAGYRGKGDRLSPTFVLSACFGSCPWLWDVYCLFRVGADGKDPTSGIRQPITIFAFLRGPRPSDPFGLAPPQSGPHIQ